MSAAETTLEGSQAIVQPSETYEHKVANNRLGLWLLLMMASQ